MRGRKRKQDIYKKSKRRRNKSAKYFNVPIYVIVLFFSGLFILLVYGIYFSLNSPKGITHSYQATKGSIGLLSSPVSPAKKTTRFPTGFALSISLPSAKKVSPTVTPKPNMAVIVPVARAEGNTTNDFCLNVPVLLYHHIQPLSIAQQLGHAQLTVDRDTFDEQMAYLAAQGYHSLSGDELADALISHHPLPAKSILITIDDGYDDNYAYAFQILKKYNIAGNFMIPTGLIENKGYMTWSQLKEMIGNPSMHIYNHTWSHAYLDGAGKDKIEYEIVTANKQIEDNLGKHTSIFTYPFGSFNDLVIGILKEHGFKAAFSTINGNIQCESYIFALRRIHIGNAPLSSYGF